MTFWLGVAFSVLWGAVGFLALRWLAGRYISGRGRPEVVAALIVLAFGIGRIVPIGTSDPPDTQALISPAGSVADVHTKCLNVKANSSPAVGSIDAIGEMLNGAVVNRLDRFVIDSGALLYVGGWAAADAHTAAQAACLVIDGAVRSDAGATYGTFRPDVATAYHSPALAPSGYALTLPSRGLSKGIHHIAVAVVSPSGAVTSLSTPLRFRIP